MSLWGPVNRSTLLGVSQAARRPGTVASVLVALACERRLPTSTTLDSGAIVRHLIHSAGEEQHENICRRLRVNEGDRLLVEIARCPVADACFDSPESALPCSQVVHAQGTGRDAFHVPEPWSGDIERAPILFVSWNPSWNPDEPFPTSRSTDDEIMTFFRHRFEHTNQDAHTWREMDGIARHLLGRDAGRGGRLGGGGHRPLQVLERRGCTRSARRVRGTLPFSRRSLSRARLQSSDWGETHDRHSRATLVFLPRSGCTPVRTSSGRRESWCSSALLAPHSEGGFSRTSSVRLSRRWCNRQVASEPLGSASSLGRSERST